MQESHFDDPKIVFATFVESEEGLYHALYLAESIREFAGRMRKAPIMVYVSDNFQIPSEEIMQMFEPLDVKIRRSSTPEDARWFYYSGKVCAAGMAEEEVVGKARILVWLDEDTIILQEPADFLLDSNISLAYRPVMHNRSGTLYDQAPNPFWGRIYEVLEVEDGDLFPMVTPADRQTIKAYFNAGLLVVRPERGILRKWGDDFVRLYHDSVLAGMCREDVEKRIFLHQTALVGAVLNTLKRDELVELSDRYNYPIFFDQMYGAVGSFESIAEVVTLRYDIYFRNPDPEWSRKLKGPAEKINWLKRRLGKKRGE